MRATSLIMFFAAIVWADTAIASPLTHCAPSEITFFSCAIEKSKKVVSLCGGRDQTTNDVAWLQYRFGVIGHPEMIFPEERLGSLNKFTGSFQHSNQAAYTEYGVWFNVGSYIYTISDEMEGEKPAQRTLGVFKSALSNAVVILGCSSASDAVVDNLGDIVPNLPENQF